jgi:predicted XRE-type DNA-binding protein
MKLKTREKPEDQEIEVSSGNVFADLGFEDAEERLFKATVVTKIVQLIGKKGWTQAQTAKRASLDQVRVSRLVRGHLSRFSADELFVLLNHLS